MSMMTATASDSSPSTTTEQLETFEAATKAICGEVRTAFQLYHRRSQQLLYIDNHVNAGTRPPNLRHVLQGNTYPATMDKAITTAANTLEQEIFSKCLNDILLNRQKLMRDDLVQLKQKSEYHSDLNYVINLVLVKSPLLFDRHYIQQQQVRHILAYRTNLVSKERARDESRARRRNSSNDAEMITDETPSSTSTTPSPSQQTNSVQQQISMLVKTVKALETKFTSALASGQRAITPNPQTNVRRTISPKGRKAVRSPSPRRPSTPVVRPLLPLLPLQPPPPNYPMPQYYQQLPSGFIPQQHQQQQHVQQQHVQQQQVQQYLRQHVQPPYFQSYGHQLHYPYHVQPSQQFTREQDYLGIGSLPPHHNLGGSTPRVRINTKKNVRTKSA